MLDVRFIKNNLEAVKANIQERCVKANADLVVQLFDERNKTLQSLENLRRERNGNAQAMKQKLETPERDRLIEEGKNLKKEIAELEESLARCEEALGREARQIPNMSHPESPQGREEKDNREVERSGELPQFDFAPKDHVDLCTGLDLVDFDTATRVSGTKFYFLKNQAVFLELALVRYALDILNERGFALFSTPDIARTSVVEGTGFNPRGAESNIYTIEGEDSCLIGTAEITLGAYYAGSVVPKKNLPIRMAGLSHCFRKEAGAAGQFSRGLYRVHQFTKVEMFIICSPEDSDTLHHELKDIEKTIFSNLGIPFRVVEACRAELGSSAYRKWDLEAWMPGRNGWGEITSTSNCTDFQSRRLDIKYKDSDGTHFAHMLNGTAIACSRAMVALIENYQNADGSITIPKALVPYCGFAEIRHKPLLNE